MPFNLEGQGQGHQFSNSSETMTCDQCDQSLKVKVQMSQKLPCPQGITQMTTQMTTEPKIICLPPVRRMTNKKLKYKE